MSFQIEQGLFNFNFQDYHAILGIPIDADLKEIRRKYMQLVRTLHPDARSSDDENDRKRAEELLSKLVNPAYQKLIDEKNYKEYLNLLKLIAQQAQKQQETVILTSNPARQLAASRELESTYRSNLSSIAEEQYTHLSKTIDLIGQLSELNLVYLMRKEGNVVPPSLSTPSSAAGTKPTASTVAQKPQQQTRSQPQPMVERYMERAKEYEKRGDFTGALKELKDALKAAPTHSGLHAMLGAIYIKTNIPTMAKVHFKKALDLDPKNQVALEGLKQVDPAAAKAIQSQQSAEAAKASSKGGKPSGGGLFGLFGGNKTGGNRK